jgi:hypothetical protein
MGIDAVLLCRPLFAAECTPSAAGVSDSDARSGSSSERFFVRIDRCGLPGPGDVDVVRIVFVVVVFRPGGLLALEAELPMAARAFSSFTSLAWWC